MRNRTFLSDGTNLEIDQVAEKETETPKTCKSDSRRRWETRNRSHDDVKNLGFSFCCETKHSVLPRGFNLNLKLAGSDRRVSLGRRL